MQSQLLYFGTPVCLDRQVPLNGKDDIIAPLHARTRILPCGDTIGFFSLSISEWGRYVVGELAMLGRRRELRTSSPYPEVGC